MGNPAWAADPGFAHRTSRAACWDARHAPVSERSRRHDKRQRVGRRIHRGGDWPAPPSIPILARLREVHMSGQGIRFDDGAAYERGMGAWSQIAGKQFLAWLAPPAGLNWIDVGCGNGAFTELLIRQCAAATVTGIDPSQAQLDYARTRPGTAGVTFQQGDAMALPFPDRSFDAASMALVLFFVPEPPKGVAEMVRVVRPGGIVAAYAWNFTTGGFPYGVIQDQLRVHGIAPPLPPNAAVAQEGAMRAVWAGAGLTGIETHTITVQRSFADFDDFWDASTASGALKPTLASLPDDVVDRMKTAVKAQLPVDAAGRVTHTASAAAVKGRVAGA